MDLSSLSKIWNVIVMSNTFNFVIFVAILAWIFKKINVGAMITSLQEKIIKIIEDAKREKAEALNMLANAEKSVANLGEELETIVGDAEKSAEVISKKIMSEAEKQLLSIELNTTRVIEAEEKMLISKLTKSTSATSVEVAKAHIKKVLEQTPSLHEKYINESINELDRLSL